MFTTTSTAATTAATVTAVGRSPVRSGTSFARASAFRNSDRDVGFGGASARTSPAAAARARFRALLDTQSRFQRRCDRARVIRVADGPDDDRAARPGRHHLADVRLVDSA